MTALASVTDKRQAIGQTLCPASAAAVDDASSQPWQNQRLMQALLMHVLTITDTTIIDQRRPRSLTACLITASDLDARWSAVQLPAPMVGNMNRVQLPESHNTCRIIWALHPLNY